jgi:hypothetical protein
MPWTLRTDTPLEAAIEFRNAIRRERAREAREKLKGTPLEEERRKKNNRNLQIWRSANPEKVKVQNIRHRERDPEHRRRVERNSYFKRKYGITYDQYEEMLISSPHCPGCDMPFGPTLLATVDHDHETGAIRGLLCGPCNGALGQSFDDPQRLIQMAAYLLRTRQ